MRLSIRLAAGCQQFMGRHISLIPLLPRLQPSDSFTVSPIHMLALTYLVSLLHVMAAASSSGAAVAGAPGQVERVAVTGQHHDSANIEPVASEGIGEQYDLVPDFDFIYLRFDAGTGCQFDGHTVLNDEANLGSSGWVLSRAADGFAFLHKSYDGDAQGHEQVEWVGEVLPRWLCERASGDDSGDLFVIDARGPSPGRVFELASLQNAGVQCKANLKPTQLSCVATIYCEIFRLPRLACIVWWRLQDIYSMCGLGGIAAGRSGAWWVHRYWPTWIKWLVEIGLGSAVHKPTARPSNASEVAETHEPREVRWPAASAPGLMAMLSRFAYAPRHLGGLKAPGDRTACQQILNTLIGGALGQEWTLEVFMEECSQWQPPRPLSGLGQLLIPVGASGVADLAAMGSHLAPQRAIIAKQLVVEHCGPEHAERVSLTNLFAALQGCLSSRGAQRVAADSLIMQLCIAIGLRLDRGLAAAWDGEQAQAESVHLVKCDFDFKNKQQRDRLRASYWMQLQTAGRAHQHAPHSCCFDFTWVGERNMFDCAVVWPTNLGGWLVPKAWRRNQGAEYP